MNKPRINDDHLQRCSNVLPVIGETANEAVRMANHLLDELEKQK